MGEIVLSRRLGSELAVLGRAVGDIAAADDSVLAPWLRGPREGIVRVAFAGRAVYCVTPSAIDRYTLLGGEAVRTAVIPLDSRMACDPAAEELSIAWIDGLGRLRVADCSSLPEDPLSLDRVRTSSGPPLAPALGRVPFALQRTGSGYAVVYARGLLELDSEGEAMFERPIAGIVVGFSYDESLAIGLTRDQNQRLYAYRPGSGFSAPSARISGLPRHFTLSRDVLRASNGGEALLWLVGGNKTLLRASVLLGSGAPEVPAVDKLDLRERVLGLTGDREVLAVLLSTEQYMTIPLPGPMPGTAAMETTGKTCSFAIGPGPDGRPIAVSRWQGIGPPLEGADSAEPPLLGARVAADASAVWIDTAQRGCRWNRASSALEQMPSPLRGEGSACLASSPSLSAFALRGEIVVTNRIFGIVRRIRAAEAPVAAAISGSILAWAAADGTVWETDASCDGGALRCGSLPAPPLALSLSGSDLAASTGVGVVLSRIERSGRRLILAGGARLGLSFLPESLAGPWEGLCAAALANRIVLVEISGSLLLGEFLNDESVTGLAFDGRGLLFAVGPSSVLSLSAGRSLEPRARITVLEDSAFVYDFATGALDGDLDAVGWFSAKKAKEGLRRVVGGSEVPADPGDGRMESALRRGRIAI
jgi:hypothetical protein